LAPRARPCAARTRLSELIAIPKRGAARPLCPPIYLDPIQGAKPMPIYADPDPDQTLKSQKVKFTKIQKPFLKSRKTGLFVNFGHFPCS
jgi:hypothetical protein